MRAFSYQVAMLALLALTACKTPVEAPLGPPPGGWQIMALPLVQADDLRAIAAKGEGAVVALWASWCEPCLEEMKTFEALQARYPKVRFVGLATEGEEAIERAQRVLDTLKPSYMQARITPGSEFEFLRPLKVYWDGVLPKTFAIRPDGTTKTAASPLPEDLEKVLVWLNEGSP